MDLTLVLATGNKGKIKEIKALCEDHKVVAYSELIEPFEIVEDGATFQENALIKARAVYRAIDDENIVVIGTIVV